MIVYCQSAPCNRQTNRSTWCRTHFAVLAFSINMQLVGLHSDVIILTQFLISDRRYCKRGHLRFSNHLFRQLAIRPRTLTGCIKSDVNSDSSARFNPVGSGFRFHRVDGCRPTTCCDLFSSLNAQVALYRLLYGRYVHSIATLYVQCSAPNSAIHS